MSKLRIAVDIGSSKTAVYQVGAGVILSEPSIVAIGDGGKKKVSFVGAEAKRMLGKSAMGTSVHLPISEGEISAEEPAKIMLKAFFDKIGLDRFGGAEVLVTVPCGTENPAIEKFRSVLSDAGLSAHAVKFIESPVATAVGLDAPVSESDTCFILDMGGGVANIAAVSLGGVIAGVSCDIGGQRIDRGIIDYIEDNYRLRVGAQTAERIKCEACSLLPGDTTPIVINGRDVDSGAPRSMQIRAMDVVEPVRVYVNKVWEIASMLLAKLPPEVAAEVRRKGIFLAGGVSGLIGLPEYFRNEFSVTVRTFEDPELSTVIGAGRIMQNEKLFKRLAFK